MLTSAPTGISVKVLSSSFAKSTVAEPVLEVLSTLNVTFSSSFFIEIVKWNFFCLSPILPVTSFLSLMDVVVGL